MKIDINLVGSAAAIPDYEMLKAALLAAQAATPTARASREAPETVPPRDAFDRLFAGNAAAADVASFLDHRFAPDPDTLRDGT